MFMQIYIYIYPDLHMWKPGSPWKSNWKYVVNLYICAPVDTHEELKIFQKV